jgi:hypothetical protein
MIKAVVAKGVIVPRDPLPADWHEGTEVAVEKSSAPAFDKDILATDAWMNAVEAVAQQGDPEDDERLSAALETIRCREKELARKKLGLEP